MKKLILFITTITLLISCNKKQESKSETIISSAVNKEKIPEFLYETTELAHCESVVFDKKRNVLYVSVQGEKTPGDGAIAKVSLEGKILDKTFIAGINNPKGIAITDDRLYVSDVTQLIEADLNTGEILNRYDGEEAEFLNDVTIDEYQNVYVSDMFTSSIYKLDKKKKFTKWYTNPILENPNGLLAIKGEIYIGAWGSFSDGNPIEAPKGNFLKLDIETKKITKITKDILGNLDGVQIFDENQFVVSDWKEGAVYLVHKNGETTLILGTERSVGDIAYIAEKKMLILPMNIQNKLIFYKY